MDAENDEYGEWERVAQDELRDSSEHHSDRSEEVVVAAQTRQTGWWSCTSPSDEDEDGARVGDQEADEA